MFVCLLDSPSGQWAQGLNERDDKQPWPLARAITACHQLEERPLTHCDTLPRNLLPHPRCRCNAPDGHVAHPLTWTRNARGFDGQWALFPIFLGLECRSFLALQHFISRPFQHSNAFSHSNALSHVHKLRHSLQWVLRGRT